MSKAIEKIKAFMEKKGMNQGDIASYVGYKSQGCMSSILSGDHMPSDKKKQFIEDKMGIKKQWWYV